MIIVLGESHYEETVSLFPERKINILAEPVGRNTAPCIGLGALFARYLGCEGPIAFLPADHFIGDNPQKGSFSGTVCPYQADTVTVFNLKIQVFKYFLLWED